MKKSSILLIVTACLLGGLILSGFQCSSTEMSSAKLYIQHSEYDKAQAALEREVAKTPTDAEAWFLLGSVRYQVKKYESMLGAFDSSLIAAPTYAEQIKQYKHNAWGLCFNDGVSYYKRMETASKDSQAVLSNDAKNSYLLAIKIEPDSASTYANLAALYHNAGDYTDEIATWRTAMAKRYNSQYEGYLITAYMHAGEDATDRHDTTTANKYFNGAVPEIKSALQQTPSDSSATTGILLRELIECYVQVDSSDLAIPYIQQALKSDPTNKLYNGLLGLRLLDSGDFTGAIARFDAVIAADANDESGYRNNAVAYMRWGAKRKEAQKDAKVPDKSYLEKYKKAAENLEKLTQLKPDDADVWETLATAYANIGKTADAKKAMDKSDSLKKK
jgi:tetratricopeptide (TPR) repeat protein